MNTLFQSSARTLTLGLLCLLATHSATAQDVFWESFEDPAFVFDGTETTGWGWFDWDLTRNGGGGSIGTLSSTGATVGANAFKLQPHSVGFAQGFAFKLQNVSNDPTRRAEAMQGFLNNTHLALEVTWDNAEWIYGGDGWNGSQISLDFNYGPGGTYVGQGFPDVDTGNSTSTGHWDNTNYPGVHTRTIMWDYSEYLPAIQSFYDQGLLTDTAGWLEFNFNTNAGNYSYPVAYYFDNFRFTTPPATTPGDFDEDGDVDGRDFLTWQRNPAVGNLADWQTNYGAGPLVSIQAVPEPGILPLLLGVVFLRRGRLTP